VRLCIYSHPGRQPSTLQQKALHHPHAGHKSVWLGCGPRGLFNEMNYIRRMSQVRLKPTDEECLEIMRKLRNNEYSTENPP
jgi:hypothetical protein